MTEAKGKTVSDSYSEQHHIVQTEHLNNIQTLFGGQLMSWMDTAAGAAGRRYSGLPVTMVAVDNMQISASARLGDTLAIRSRVTNVGRSSLEILVEVDIEEKDKSRKTISTAFFVGVVLDEDGRPTPAPPLIIETEEEQKLFDAAEKRKELRAYRREMQF